MTFEAYETSSSQKRLYLIHQLYEDGILYNMPFGRIIEGHLDPLRLETAVKKLVHRHETLRTSFVSKEGEVLQIVHKHLENGAPRNLTIDEIARNYIEKIKNLQPEGPYYLAAWCFGGLIAFEMVKQWEKQGEQIGFFGLINSPPPPPPNETRIKSGEFNLESELKLIEEYSLGFEIKEKLKNVNELSQFWLLLTDYLETNNYDIEPFK